VVTDNALIEEMNQTCFNVLAMLHAMYNNDALVKGMVQVYQQFPQPGLFDPASSRARRSIARKSAPVLLNAPW